MTDHFANFAVSQVASPALTTTSNSLTLSPGTGAKFPNAPFSVLLGDPTATYEIVQCTAISGDTLTITRHQEGTVAGNWGIGASVAQVVTAGNLTNIWSELDHRGVFNAKDYGAVGDGATDDTSAINATISACVAAGGGVVDLPPGIFATSGPIIISGDLVELRGAGAVAGNTNAARLGATIIQPMSGATYDAIRTPLPPTIGTAGYVVYGAHVRDLTIDCTHMTGTVSGQGNGLHFYGVRYGLVENVNVFHSPNWAFLFDGDSTNYAYNSSMFNCTAGQCAAGVRWSNSEQGVAINCIFEGANTACAAPQPYGSASPTTYAALIYCNTGWCRIISCNIGTSGSYTGEALLVDNGETCMIANNVFDAIHGVAIKLSAGGHTVVGNAIRGPGTTTAGPAISVGSSNNTIIGNVVQVVGAHMTYSVQEFSAQTNNVISGNVLVAGTSGVVAPNTGSTGLRIQNNSGYNPVGHSVAQPAIPASTTAQTNQSGVDCMVYVSGGTVSAIAVNGTTTGLTSGAFRVPSGATITLTYSSAPTWQWFGE